MSHLIWWSNGRHQGAFDHDIFDTNLYKGDGFALISPLNRLVRRIDGHLEVLELNIPTCHLSRCEATNLADAFLKHPPGTRWSWLDLLDVVGYRGKSKHIHTTVNRWMVHLRHVLQDSRPNVFLCTDSYYIGAGAASAWFLDPKATYLLVERDCGTLSH